MNKFEYVAKMDEFRSMIAKLSSDDFEWLMNNNHTHDYIFPQLKTKSIYDINKHRYMIDVVINTVKEVLNCEVKFKYYESVGNLYFVSTASDKYDDIENLIDKIIKKSGIKELNVVLLC